MIRHSNNLPIEAIYQSYDKLTHHLPATLRWYALVLAPARTSIAILLAGLLSIAGSAVITGCLSVVSSHNNFHLQLIILLIIGFIASSIGYWIKERQELLLTVIIRQITYRRFHDIFTQTAVPSDTRKHLLTYPAQISQFAFIVDALVSAIQSATFLIMAFIWYGVQGFIATLIITILIIASVRIIHLIGHLWEQYVALEGSRRRWIQRMAESLPRGAYIPSWQHANYEVNAIRAQEEVLLHQRTRLQMLNGFLDKGMLTFVLAIVAACSAWLWPQSDFGIGIILAAQYLYSSVHNNIVNYQVIRLAIPMMRELDTLEEQHNYHNVASQNSIDITSYSSNKQYCTIEVEPLTSQRAHKLRALASTTGITFIPRNPELHQMVLAHWREQSTPAMLRQFKHHASAMDLHEETLARLWEDTTTLSSGEIHRAALALALVETPQWLILEDTFAALDPLTREHVANYVTGIVPVCTLLTSSQEYVPTAFQQNQPTLHSTHSDADSTTLPVTERDTISPIHHTEQTAQEPIHSAQYQLPDPTPKQATFWSSLLLLFGFHAVTLVIGALMITSAEVCFASLVAHDNMQSPFYTSLAILCAFMILSGSMLFFRTIYQIPIARLSVLHQRIIGRIQAYATPQNSGSVVARLGEDFSHLQMEVPSALGSSLLVIMQTGLLIAGAVIGTPLFLLIIVIVAPLAILALRQGSQWVLTASTFNANQRDQFLSAANMQANPHSIPVSILFQKATDSAYYHAEAAYLHSCVNLTQAYAKRTGLIQLLIVLLNSTTTLLVFTIPSSYLFIVPTAVVYFAITLSSGVQSTIETLQQVGVAGLVSGRVKILQYFRQERAHTLAQIQARTQVTHALEADVPMIAVIGKTGAGKSVMLDEIYRQHPPRTVALIPDIDPFAEEQSPTSGLTLAQRALHDEHTKLLLFDETFKALQPEVERTQLKLLQQTLVATHKQAVIVLHSRSNLDCFQQVVQLHD